MESRPLKLLAAVTALAALLFGYLAFVTSRADSASQQALPARGAERVDGPRAVVAAIKIEKGQTIAAEALQLVAMPTLPADGYTRLEEVVGKAPAVAINPGEPLNKGHFAAGSTLARSLDHNERALAIQVNEVTGVGGLLQAGDLVDVVAYVAADGRQVTRSQARIILERVRVLAYGATGPNRTGNNTAVLAVPAADVPRLVLAANAGSLRLALHAATAAPGSHLQQAALLRELEGPVSKTDGEVVIIRGGAVTRTLQ